MVLIGKAGASNDSILASARSKPPSSLMTQHVLDKSQSEPRTNTDALHHAAQSDANRLASGGKLRPVTNWALPTVDWRSWWPCVVLTSLHTRRGNPPTTIELGGGFGYGG